MTFFNRKKRFGDVEGYERISRSMEERQRELTGDHPEDDALEEDTVVLSPQARGSREPITEAVELVRPSQARAVDVPPAPRPERAEAPAPAAPGPVVAPRMAVPVTPAVSSGACLVSKDAVWDGKLSCNGDVRIDGVLQGEVETSGTLFIAADARVQGIVRARNVMLAGDIDGQLRCEERLEILPGGSARGEIDTGTLVVHEGAYIESRFQMRRGPAGVARP